MTLSTKVIARVRAELSGAVDQGSTLAALLLDMGFTLDDGTGSGEADRVFSDQRSLSASATETHDLTSLTDVFGAALSFAKIKVIAIKAAASNTNNVLVGAAASNQFLGPLAHSSDIISIPPGGVALLTAPASGWAVANGSTDNLKIANSAGSTAVLYDIMLVGTSA